MTVKPVIHVGVDGSWRDTGALEWALQESLLRQAPLQAVHVIENAKRDADEDAAAELVTEVQKFLDESPDSRLGHEAGLLVGPPARTLTDAAAGSEMLVVGRRGMGTFKRLLIGSTSEAVAVFTTVPVVVVPEHWTPAAHAGPVVVALDDSDNYSALLEFAITAAAERHLPVRIVHLWDLPAMYSWDAVNVAGISAEWNENAERHLENVAAEWRTKYPDQKIEFEARRGHPVDGIISAAAETDAQLLVVGTRHHTRMATILLGSVSRGVLHHAACPLAVVPAEGAK